MTNRTFNIARQLARRFDITILAFSRRNHQADDAAREAAGRALSELLSAEVHSVRVSAEHSLLARARVHLASLATGRPYTYFEYGSAAIASQLSRVLVDTPPALVHLDSLDLYRWLSSVRGLPVAVTHHSVESDLLRLRARHHPNRLFARYLSLQAGLLERVERKLCPDVGLNVMMSPVDAARLSALAPGARTTVAPNGVDTSFLVPAQPERIVAGRVVFLGPTYMYPNKDGLDFFLREAWPRVRELVPGATLHLVGKNAPEDRNRLSAVPGVACLGFVPDIRPCFAEAACSIVPLRIGGGTRLKILDAWALGKAVVSTTVGCEGLEASDGVNLLIRDDPLAFAEAVAEVLRDPDRRQALERAGRQTVEEHYSWETIGGHLRDEYLALLSRVT